LAVSKRGEEMTVKEYQQQHPDTDFWIQRGENFVLASSTEDNLRLFGKYRIKNVEDVDEELSTVYV